MMVPGIVMLAVTPVVWCGLWRAAAYGNRHDWVAPVWLAVLGIPGWPAFGAYLLGYEDAPAVAGSVVLAGIFVATLAACMAASVWRP